MSEGSPDSTGSSDVVKVELRENGPIVVTGSVTLDDGNGPTQVKRLFLCRCGGSANKPMCDGTHKSNGFTAAGCPPPNKPLPGHGGRPPNSEQSEETPRRS